MSRLYINSSLIVQAVEEKKQSLKKYCHGKEAAKIGKTEYLLACETLKYSEVLDNLFEESKIDAVALDVSVSLLKVMTYELLFGRGKIQGGGQVKRRLQEHIDPLRSALRDQMARKGVTSHDKLLSRNIQLAAALSKYIRINEIAKPIAAAYELVRAAYPSAELDAHIPSLVCLPPNTSGLADFAKKHRISADLTAATVGSTGDGSPDGDALVSTFIIQDKASCMPAQVLFDEFKNISKKKSKASRRTDFIDACAAPGNKTSHLASLVYTHAQRDYGANTVHAFDKSLARSKLLNDRMMAAGAHNVTVQNFDFLEVDAEADTYSDVRFLLLDPSCSGSGVVRALERVLETESGSSSDEKRDDTARLKRLQDFQIQVIAKAMSFPAAEALVYSTCSVHREENEEVVRQILEGFPDWDVQLPSCLASWHRRGLPTPGLTEAQQAALIRCQPEDGMNGFFVALFKKKSHVGTGSQSRVEFQFSPPPSSAKPSDHNNDQAVRKRKHETEDSNSNSNNNNNNNNSKQWFSNSKKCSKVSANPTHASSALAPEGKAKKTRNDNNKRMLTLWKPKKRR